MEDILDDHLVRKNKLGIYSKLSFSVGLFLTIKLIYSILTMPSKISTNEELNLENEASNFHYLTFLVIAGVVFALLSIIKKEDSHWVKWTGLIICSLWFLVMMMGITQTW